MDDQRSEWGQQIRDARQRKGISQEDLALFWRKSGGGTLSYLQKIETGARGNEETFNALMSLIRQFRKAS